MARFSVDKPSLQQGRRPTRRGFSTVGMLACLAVAITLTGAVINLAWVASDRVDLQAACDAAALAGAAHMMDPSHLFVSRGAGGSSYEPDPKRRAAMAEKAARHFAEKNIAAVCAVGESSEKTGCAPLSIMLGWDGDPSSRTDQVEPWTGVGPVNSVFVQIGRPHPHGPRGAAWFGRLSGWCSGEVAAVAGASVDQRLYGFRPAEHVRVPFMPILLLPEAPAFLRRSATRAGERQGHGRQHRQAGPPGAGHDGRVFSDAVTLDPVGETLSPGADGIPEFTLQLRCSDEGGNEEEDGDDRNEAEEQACLVTTTPGANWLKVLPRQMAEGLAAEDLVALGGELSLAGPRGLLLAEAKLKGPQELARLQEALRATIGKPRAWPVGERAGGSAAVCRAQGFAAAAVIGVRRESEDSLTVVVQPCLLQTCTALVGPPWGRHRSIGKLVVSN
jgi:hypothetical protein